jgi:hypothetical protein
MGIETMEVGQPPLITVGLVPKSFFNAKKNKGSGDKRLTSIPISFKVLHHIENSNHYKSDAKEAFRFNML